MNENIYISIKNRADVEFAYFIIGACENRVANRVGTVAELKKCADTARAYKRAVRAYYRQQAERMGRSRGIYYDDSGFEITLEELPASILTRAEAEAYFNDNMRLYCYPSQYDCTGKVFTIRAKFVNRRGTWFVYHYIGRDI